VFRLFQAVSVRRSLTYFDLRVFGKNGESRQAVVTRRLGHAWHTSTCPKVAQMVI
jgi:hypothetical protein